MPGCIDDVNDMVFVFDGCVFRENRDATLPLEIVAVHHTLTGTGANGSGLLKQTIHQGGLAMIDVRDDGYIAKDMIGH